MIRLKEYTVRKMITQTGYSVKAWAEKNGFPQGTLSGWLTGARNIKRSSLEKLAEALRCKVEDIADIVWEYSGHGVAELEADREEISGIFGNLTAPQRKAVINLADVISDANRQAQRIEEEEL